jgi:hypothetical protein
MARSWFGRDDKIRVRKVTGTIEERQDIVTLYPDESLPHKKSIYLEDVGNYMMERIEKQDKELIQLRRKIADQDKIIKSLECDLGVILRQKEDTQDPGCHCSICEPSTMEG